MAKAKITHFWDTDVRNRSILVIKKAKGKLNLDEIAEYLLYEAKIHGHYAITINASESACGGCGWGDEVTEQGDTVILYEVYEKDNCPICGGTTPYQHCPECGYELKN